MNNNAKQLYHKDKEEYKSFFPIVRLEDIIETITDKSIQWLFNNYNHIYVEFKESVAETRNKVPNLLRRNGLWITYNTGKELITEQYIGSNNDVENYRLFTDDICWKRFDDVEIKDGSITKDKLSKELQNIISDVDIVNNPDEEDLTTIDNKLKIKDRDYNKDNFSGLGHVILRKNIKSQNGKLINILTQDMINKPNTIYEIRYDFDLNGEEVTIPEGCVLKFESGSLKNGKVKGTLFNRYLKPEWFGAKGDGVTDDTEAIQNCIDLLHSNRYMNSLIEFSGRTYIISNIQLKAYVNLRGSGIGCTVLKSNANGDIITIVENNNMSSICNLSIAGNSNNIGINIIGGTSFGEFGPLNGNYVKKEYSNKLKLSNINNVTIYGCNIGINSIENSIGLFKINNIDILYCNTGIAGDYIDGEISNFEIGWCVCAINASFGNCRIGNGKFWFCGGDRTNKIYSTDDYALKIKGDRNIISDIDLQDCWCNGMYLSANNSLVSNMIFDDSAYASMVQEDNHNDNLYYDLYITGLNNQFNNISFTFYKTNGIRNKVKDIIYTSNSSNKFSNCNISPLEIGSIIPNLQDRKSQIDMFIDYPNSLSELNIKPNSFVNYSKPFNLGLSMIIDVNIAEIGDSPIKFNILDFDCGDKHYYTYIKTYQKKIYFYFNDNQRDIDNLLYTSSYAYSGDLNNIDIKIFGTVYNGYSYSFIAIKKDNGEYEVVSKTILNGKQLVDLSVKKIIVTNTSSNIEIKNIELGNYVSNYYNIVHNIDYEQYLIINDTTKYVIIYESEGTSTQRPTGVIDGFEYYDTTIRQPIYWNESRQGWINADGYAAGVRSGVTQRRTELTEYLVGLDTGLQFFDITLGKTVVWNGATWINVDGSALE